MGGGEGKLQSHGGERSNGGVEDKADRCRPALTRTRGLSAHPPPASREAVEEKSGPAKGIRDFFLPLYFLVREERGLRALLKGAPETGASHG